MIPARLPPGALVRLLRQSNNPGMLFSSQQQIDFAAPASLTFHNYLIGEARDFGCLSIHDADAILPYSTLELIFMEAGAAGMPAPTPYTWPIQIIDGATAESIADTIVQQINLWKAFFAAYPGFKSLTAKVVTRGGTPFVRILLPFGMLGTADADIEMPSAIYLEDTIGQDVPLMPTIRGRNLGLLPVRPYDAGYYYGDNPYEYYTYDYLGPRT